MRRLLLVEQGEHILATTCHRNQFYTLTAEGSLGNWRVTVRNLSTGWVWVCPVTFRHHTWHLSFHLLDGELWANFDYNDAVQVDTGEVRMILTDGAGAYATDWQTRRRWFAERNTNEVNKQSVRALGTDSYVLMTGSGARTAGEVAMGPTQYRKVMATKGLSSGCVVIYKRGGSARVLKVDKKHNPINIVVSDDGLTFLAVCSRAVYQIDTDSGDE
jgi:hypothetical protein